METEDWWVTTAKKPTEFVSRERALERLAVDRGYAHTRTCICVV